jgi:uncharacterized protein (DUF2141 family)
MFLSTFPVSLSLGSVRKASIASCLIAPLLCLSSYAAHGLELAVEITGARSAKGQVMAEVYTSAEGWLKKPLQGERVQAGERVLLVFRNLPAGRYALSAFHDENANGKFDMNLMGLPTEVHGFSKDAKGVMGPAKFEDAVITLDSDTSIKVTLQ